MSISHFEELYSVVSSLMFSLLTVSYSRLNIRSELSRFDNVVDLSAPAITMQDRVNPLKDLALGPMLR